MAVQDNEIQSFINNYYFKTRADYEAHINEISNNSTIYIENDGEYGNIKMNTLWENANPTSNFAAQDITTLNMEEFNYIMIEYHNDTTPTPKY